MPETFAITVYVFNSPMVTISLGAVGLLVIVKIVKTLVDSIPIIG